MAIPRSEAHKTFIRKEDRRHPGNQSTATITGPGITAIRIPILTRIRTTADTIRTSHRHPKTVNNIRMAREVLRQQDPDPDLNKEVIYLMTAETSFFVNAEKITFERQKDIKSFK
jgi:hypothetical protein